MHLEDKNLSGKIFGGLIMRLAYELGWLCVFKFLKGKFATIANIDDVQFLGAVRAEGGRGGKEWCGTCIGHGGERA